MSNAMLPIPYRVLPSQSWEDLRHIARGLKNAGCLVRIQELTHGGYVVPLMYELRTSAPVQAIRDAIEKYSTEREQDLAAEGRPTLHEQAEQFRMEMPKAVTGIRLVHLGGLSADHLGNLLWMLRGKGYTAWLEPQGQCVGCEGIAGIHTDMPRAALVAVAQEVLASKALT